MEKSSDNRNPDPRIHNSKFSDHLDVELMKKEYASWLESSLLSVDNQALTDAINALKNVASANKRVFMIGNGGSAAIADHLSADLTKGTYFEDQPRIRSISLTSNMALYTASSNDFGFEGVFVNQLDFLADEGDLLIAISSSGSSKNICDAVTYAKEKGMLTIGLSGFDGGDLRREADISLHTNTRNYGVVEDTHQALLHIMTLGIIEERSSENKDMSSPLLKKTG